ncbi:MAG: 3-keto-disaccharide hydrolase [Verrucomicrobiales bacterium]|tara:strand:+ start:195 stop:2225 length:2031 start_codon:yes stop_codon:yes gene_type:complete
MVKIFFILLFIFSNALASEQQLYVGCSEVSITPNEPVALEGSFTLRISDGIHSPIQASVLAIGTGGSKALKDLSIIVSADLVHIPNVITNKLRQKVSKLLPELDVSKIFICATHTHQAPVVMSDNFILPKEIMSVDEYIDFFVKNVSSAVVKACNNIQPGSYAWGLGHAQVSHNRRDVFFDGTGQVYGGVDAKNYRGPEGPEYQGIPVIYFFDREGKLLASCINVWSPSQEYFGGNKISADFWHPVRKRLKSEWGDDFVVIAWCGAAGDQGPVRRFHTEAENRMMKLRGSDSWVDEFGRRISESVLDTYSLIKNERKSKIIFSHEAESIPLPGWLLSDDEIKGIKGWMNAYKKELDEDPSKSYRLARPISWRKQTLERQELFKNQTQGFYPSEIHVLRIGDVAVCTNQFELYTEYGLRILGRSDASMTCVVQLAGPAHYLSTAKGIENGGYGSRPESCAVASEGGDVLVNVSVDKVNKLFDPLVRNLPPHGKLVDNKPNGLGWEDLLKEIDIWDYEKDYWNIGKDIIIGSSEGGDHHFCWTKESFKDFQAHLVFKLTGSSPNSGFGIRLNPVSFSDVPGYQIDMGRSYWGSLWEEGGDGMVDQFNPKYVDRFLNHNDWNHYYVEAKGNHIKAWLNGVSTIDVIHENGPIEGRLGFELCNGPKQTKLEVRVLYVRKM